METAAASAVASKPAGAVELLLAASYPNVGEYEIFHHDLFSKFRNQFNHIQTILKFLNSLIFIWLEGGFDEDNNNITLGWQSCLTSNKIRHNFINK